MSKILATGYVLYPDSMSCTVEDIISIYGSRYPIAISPLHDKDIKSDGTLKKPHYHVFFPYKLKKIHKDFFLSIIGDSASLYFQDLFDPIQSYKYLTHDGFLNKVQYSKSDIIQTDYDWESLPSSDFVPDMFHEMVDFVVSNHITEFSTFVLLLYNQPDDNLRAYCWKNESKIKHFIDSRRYQCKSGDDKNLTYENLYSSYCDLVEYNKFLKSIIKEYGLISAFNQMNFKEIGIDFDDI